MTQSRLASQFNEGGAQLLCMDGDRETLDAQTAPGPRSAEGDGELVAACVYDPLRDEAYTAHRGGGATCNGRPEFHPAPN